MLPPKVMLLIIHTFTIFAGLLKFEYGKLFVKPIDLKMLVTNTLRGGGMIVQPLKILVWNKGVGNCTNLTIIRTKLFIWHSLRLNADLVDTALQKKFKTVLQILRPKPKLWKKLYFYKWYIFNVKIHFFF